MSPCCSFRWGMVLTIVIGGLGLLAFFMVNGDTEPNPSSSSLSSMAESPPTYHENIASILHESCSSCHRPDGGAPFSLLSYKNARRRGRQIVQVTKSRYMPPWKAEPGHGEFEGARRLPDETIELLEAWVQGGMKEGDPAAGPPPPQYTEGWSLGEPDLVIQMKKPFKIPAEGPEIFRRFGIPLDIPEDRYIKAIEFRPTSPDVVHHVFIMRTNANRQGNGDGLGFEGELLEGWTPGAITKFLPDGVAKHLKKGDTIVLRSHFRPSGKIEHEQSKIGFYFGDPPKRALTGLRLRNNKIDILPGEDGYTVSDTVVVPADTDAIGIAAHAHYICREVRATATYPDQTTEWLLLIKDWDFNWQEHYRFAKPVFFPKGTVLNMEYVYDNTASNPRNPFDPPRRVRYGQLSTDEMAILYIEALLKDDADLPLFKNLLIQGKNAGKKEASGKPK